MFCFVMGPYNFNHKWNRHEIKRQKTIKFRKIFEYTQNKTDMLMIRAIESIPA